jgi:hypothetical protein
MRRSACVLLLATVLVAGFVSAGGLHGLGSARSSAPGTSAASPGPATPRPPEYGPPPAVGASDALSSEERVRAEGLARAAIRKRTASSAHVRRRLVLLAVERQRAEHAGKGRRADALFYDYATDEAVRAVVDLDAGLVGDVAASRGVQPPPTPEEARQALELILADPTLGPALKRTVLSMAGIELTGSGGLSASAVAFRAAQAHGLRNAGAVAACGRQRCVQLFLKIPQGGWIDASRVVVNLSRRQVVVLTPPGP